MNVTLQTVYCNEVLIEHYQGELSIGHTNRKSYCRMRFNDLGQIRRSNFEKTFTEKKVLHHCTKYIFEPFLYFLRRKNKVIVTLCGSIHSMDH